MRGSQEGFCKVRGFYDCRKVVRFPRVDCAKCEDYSRDVAKSGGCSRDLAKCGVPRFSRAGASQKRGCKVRGDSRNFELSTRDLAECGVPNFFQKGRKLQSVRSPERILRSMDFPEARVQSARGF